MRVDWNQYAGENTYDNLARHNPEYSALVRHVLQVLSELGLPEYARIAELRGGTGNFSLALASAYPGAEVTLLDITPGMLAAAECKISTGSVQNLRLLQGDMTDLPFEDDSLDAVLYIHSIYAIPLESGEPRGQKRSLREAWRSLRPGGFVIMSDIGRIVPVRRLAWKLFWISIHAIGLWHTIRLYSKNLEAVRQNRRVQQDQQRGNYWLHDLAEVESILRETGFENFSHKRDDLYFGLDDFIVARKPQLQRKNQP